MARGDYTGVPDVAPELQAPNDYQHVEASPQAFGAQIGEGAEAVGQAGLHVAQFYNQVAADNATNNFLDQREKILYGDPNKVTVGPDGTPQPDTGYFGLRGSDAMAARPEVQQQLDELISQEREGLSTPRSQQQYDVDTRRYRAQTMADIGTHADQQQRVWATDTNNNLASIGLNTAVRAGPNDDAAQQGLEQVRQASVKNAQLQFGHDPSVTQSAILKADQTVYSARIKALLGNNDPVNADRLLQAHSDILGSLPEYDQLTRQVKDGVFDAQETPLVNGAVGDALVRARGLAQSAQPPAAGAPAGATTPGPTGPVYDQIEQAAVKAGATPGEVGYLKRAAQVESNGNPNAMNGPSTGLFQFHPDTFSKLGGTDIHDTGQQTEKALELARNNRQALTSAGVQPTDANLYLMHQQGAAGGLALLTAPPNVGAVAALTPTYETHGRTPEQAQAIAERAVTGNGGTPDMTAAQFAATWTQRWGAEGGGSAGEPSPYPSTADALRANIGPLTDDFRTKAEAQFPNQPQRVERAVDNFQRRINQTISQQEQQYTVDTHIVQAAAADPNVISETDLMAKGPEVAQAWRNMQFNNPYGAMSLQRRFDANSHGPAATFGTEAYDYINRVLAPGNDPNRIKDPAQLNSFVGPGDESPLTNTGVNAFSGILALRGNPQGEAFAAQARAFLDQMHGQITFADKSVGYADPKGEERYSKFLATALPIMTDAFKNGALSKVMDPNAPDYLGKAALPFMRTPTEIMRDRGISPTPVQAFDFKSGGPAAQGRFLLKQSVDNGDLTISEATAIGEARGWFAKAPAKPGASTPVLTLDASGQMAPSP